MHVGLRWAKARTRARRWPRVVSGWFQARAGHQLPGGWDKVEGGEALHARPFWRPLKQALASYAAPETTCTVTFFHAGVPTVQESHVRMVPAHGRTEECYFIDGPGVSHHTLMQEPHVDVLASAR